MLLDFHEMTVVNGTPVISYVFKYYSKDMEQLNINGETRQAAKLQVG